MGEVSIIKGLTSLLNYNKREQKLCKEKKCENTARTENTLTLGYFQRPENYCCFLLANL